MNKKTLSVGGGMLLLLLTLSLSSAYANHGRGGHGKDGGFEKMFFMKAHSILDKKQELGLTEDKVEAVKTLKLETQKALIKQNAEIEVLALEIQSKLHEYPVDAEAVKKLVSQKYDLKKAQAEGLVDAVAKLKGTLSKEQYDKLIQLWEESSSLRFRRSGRTPNRLLLAIRALLPLWCS